LVGEVAEQRAELAHRPPREIMRMSTFERAEVLNYLDELSCSG
jgi:hypothetical protein